MTFSQILILYLIFSLGTLGVYDLVYDMTGFDMTTTTKEDLHKEMQDVALSAIAFTPDASEVCGFWITFDHDIMMFCASYKLSYLCAFFVFKSTH